ncbi:hypothetical protein NAEGRDRAFT_77715 [Naegleria gruberi]|uniref:Uncharacterized protein n=1 Tax=Naegleria gruberi TaxID=5762 RepID=D2UXV1_NAEGR|nr:uncharacterized protein NAEGRDRAFT_77715 [Naegleria gruberi]EFC50352.1 hypothetical protein NAEGRDRAFT_77715 [Naegleria gruberi]|eukprot:XP_002683096.1 hypothetical protein NAEGRDRAFT_77715 [Naegleria gruberi strain NEG-M]
MTEIQSKGSEQSSKTIMFNVCKNEYGTPKNNLQKLYKKLRMEYKTIINEEDFNLEKLKQADLVIFCGPRLKFTEQEFAAIGQYIKEGGSVLFQLGEGGEPRFETNINYLLEEWGVFINSDTVIRTSFFKYYHPKEVCVQKGVLNRSINREAGKGNDLGSDLSDPNSHLTFVYPYGATLNVESPSTAILASGHISYPVNRPVCAFYSSKNDKGRVAVIGSVHLFDDKWLEKEENSVLQDVIFKWLLFGFDLNQIDATSPEVNDYQFLPDSKSLSEKVKPCLQESEELPIDFTELFVDKMFKFDTDLIPEAVNLYAQLGVKHSPLTLIPPAFETPLPSLRPAVYPPSLREFAPPEIDLFDLDEQFASEDVRLAQLTNRCTDEDADYFIQKAGEIVGVTKLLKSEYSFSAKHILELMFRQIVQFKKVNPSNEDILPSHLRHNKVLPKLAKNIETISNPVTNPPTPISSPLRGGNLSDDEYVD